MGLFRHPGLQPLSRQHHDMLHHARTLREAAAEGGPDAADTAARFLAFWEQHGEPHFRFEENQLIACYANHCDIQRDPAVKTMLQQHTQIRRLVEQLRTDLAHRHEVTPLITQLGQQLDEHIRHEERVVFSQVQQRVPEEELHTLSALGAAPCQDR